MKFTTSVFLVRDNHVYLVNHRKAAQWLPVGGKLKKGESPADGAMRELTEETSIDNVFFPHSNVPGGPAGFMCYSEHPLHWVNPESRSVLPLRGPWLGNFSFMAMLHGKEQPELDEKEHLDGRWFDLRQIDAGLSAFQYEGDMYRTSPNVLHCLEQLRLRLQVTSL